MDMAGLFDFHETRAPVAEIADYLCRTVEEIPPRRRDRAKPMRNPRRPLQCDCGLPFPKRRRPEFFHAESATEGPWLYRRVARVGRFALLVT
jgi:hypothetical protein